MLLLTLDSVSLLFRSNLFCQAEPVWLAIPEPLAVTAACLTTAAFSFYVSYLKLIEAKSAKDFLPSDMSRQVSFYYCCFCAMAFSPV